MQKGFKTSEFYIILAIIAPYILQQFGVDLSAIAANPDDMSIMISTAQQGGYAPVWVAGIYVVGRVLLKILSSNNKNEPKV